MTFLSPSSRSRIPCLRKEAPVEGWSDVSPAVWLLIRRSVGGICGIGNKLCWLLAACQSRAAVPGSGSLPERHGARRKNAVQGSLSSQNPRAVLASQLRVYDFVVCDVMRVLAFRNFTTEEAVWNAGRILETFGYALGFFLVSSEQRYRWIRVYVFF